MEPNTYFLTMVEDVRVRNLKPAVVKIYDYYDKSKIPVPAHSKPLQV